MEDGLKYVIFDLIALLYLITPILGLVWLGKRQENKKYHRILRDSIRITRMSRISRGK